MSATTDTWVADWQQWHTDRAAEATAVYGIAAASGTHWLSETPLTIAGVPGSWVAEAGRAVGDGPGLHLELAPGERHQSGELLLQPLIRAGAVALRVFDPQASTRTTLQGIGAFDPDPAWVIDGIVETTSAALKLDHVDGFVSDNDGVSIRLTINGREVVLWGTATPAGGIQITFADTTNGAETQRFRFLTVAAPDAQGRVVADFNRAYLPPCTFSDHYLCPLPPASNRLDFPVRAGETRLLRADR
ncbi:DUF1684 domain-containing protein [Nocardia sp. SYP-A9097]|uniref:DUF1684 domain-containing protein n=1 Tax=Nocardia sp. SYP-A9097 TaxID=2663237 RepID=UPI001321782C|nr:DUF1684 domain-containing protein [Nocardia sp. SYP-A9097]MRH91244.1 DUF1684 domain-containing protein [Nocardia sp. SYP-A9097]